ncbi:acetyltransferase (GNAT) family protein [Saccharopolyspora erythraea NRRL 2338]|uniref:Acetyltransferase n=2 Tax=Saccharopolyspora erythraea TaxID=1836 RepID=A4F9J9_SACEN|nr:GNAT family N-acetyltransferase [Saccharopolyspora erythraea]EQD87388.1 acetyltransferase [Saccharopolyspora erythraea D]PFG94510.1 acetyltransferase (GNAT) family protein [Saccharopolyspora erythraea NRRL 2338]QRK91261.1 GNAT family N-acetyltransferase [Saccharopolyspora erythraea]CAM00724.1 acetyltransferase [Saccharopolyspora erythraea NRRL 2338]
MGEDVFVTGPHRVDTPHPDLVDGLADLWGRVTVAGGGVGFTPADPVEEVREAAASVVDDVAGRRAHLLTIGREHVLVGVAVLVPGRYPVRRHTGELSVLMVDPDLQGQGWGRKLHDAAVAHAQALGLEKLELVVRGGHDLERFYTGLGWTESGRWERSVRVADGDDRDRIWFTRDV